MAVPEGVRPLSDRAREGLFASLGAEVEGAHVLDLFAGTGAIGIEAISRGSAHSTFVERSGPAIAAVRENLAKTHLAELATVVPADVLTFVRSPKPTHGTFDIVFLDPPYELEPPHLDEALKHLADAWLRAPWTVVLTRGRKNPKPVIPLHWHAARQLRYGDSLVTLFREVGWA